jgi:hypothetical protein
MACTLAPLRLCWHRLFSHLLDSPLHVGAELAHKLGLLLLKHLLYNNSSEGVSRRYVNCSAKFPPSAVTMPVLGFPTLDGVLTWNYLPPQCGWVSHRPPSTAADAVSTVWQLQ